MLKTSRWLTARVIYGRGSRVPGASGPAEHHAAAALHWLALSLTLGFGFFAASAGTARSQDAVKNFKKPILMVETGGHHARVRSLIWQDGSTLLSGGEDKVVKVWNFQDGARLARSIRPPIWRGAAGIIYAMALTKPDPEGQSFLAVGGYGVENRRGDLTIFRVPGVDAAPGVQGRIPSGEVVARLLSQPANQPQATGHIDSVLCLAFDPSGRVLASGSNDTTAILWDIPAFQPRVVLRGHTKDVRALAFSPDGARVATAGGDGSLRLWSVATGAQVDIKAGDPQNPRAINTLAFSPDGQSIVVGRESGEIFRFDARSLSQINPVSLPLLATQGPVESLTYSPDGTRLAVSVKSDKANTIDPVLLGCDVELRAMPAGDLIRRWPVRGLVYGLAFSPTGDRLAYAGGHTQSIFIQQLRDLQSPPLELKGQGSTPFDLGFTQDSQTIGFTRALEGPANAPTVEAFDLGQRKTRNLSRDQLRGAIRSLNGWTVNGDINQYRLEAVNQDGRRWRFDLDPATERLWWSYTMIPSGPGHPRSTVAVGCESGVVVCDLDTGRRTRVFAGHSSPVVSLAPSPDGRWLASSSIDQTIMVYPLDGCDRRPGFGATLLQQPDKIWVVSRVEPEGFAASTGLLPGDVIVKAGIARGHDQAAYYVDETVAGFVRDADALRPGLDTIAIWTRRKMWIAPLGALDLAMPPVPSTKRDNPVLTLMLGMDKEWVVWTPRGFYDTSVEGDARFLGWHINSEYQSARPTDFVPIGAYAKTMLQPGALDRLWRSGKLEPALAQAAATERPVYEQRPPRVTFTSVERGIRLPAPGVVWMVSMPNPRLGVHIKADGPSRISSRRVILDERALELPAVPEARPEITENLQIDLVPKRRVRLAVEAANENGIKRLETIDLVFIPPPDAPPVPQTRPRLFVLGIGNDQARRSDRLPRIPFADKDAVDLADFLIKHLVSRDGIEVLQDSTDDRIVLTGQSASVHPINQALGKLDEKLQTRQVHKGDIVAVIVASHVLAFDKSAMIVGADTDPERMPRPDPMVMAQDLSDLLGRLADYGCRAMLFVDGVHDLPENGFKSDIKSWVRELQGERRVITFVASKEGPSRVDSRIGRGLFALGVARAFQQVVAAGKATDQPYTLEEFGRAVRQMVWNLSGRQQEAYCYIPPGVYPQTLFARP
jgi:WD40 repeat protein